jgi:hypothetical protein
METQALDAWMGGDTATESWRDAMDVLYGHLHASPLYHEVYGNLTVGTRTCVIREGGNVAGVILYRIEQDRARVLNEQCAFPRNVVEAFAQHVFAHFSEVTAVCFPAMRPTFHALAYPFIAAKRTQDIVLSLPESADAYRDMLGKSTRTYIKRYFNKLKRCFPSVSWTSDDGDKASEEDIRAVIEFNRARMAGKYKDSYIDDAEADRILQLVRRCGFVTVMRIAGKVCAGTINYRIGDNYFLQVIAHNPAYDEYGLGTLCCYLTVCECIARKGREYHFLWGRYEYKYRLLGVQQDMSDVLVYRSRRHMLRDGRMVLGMLCAGRLYEAKDWMEHRARRMDDSSLSGKVAYRCLNALKQAKRSIDRRRMHQRHPNVTRHSPEQPNANTRYAGQTGWDADAGGPAH